LLTVREKTQEYIVGTTGIYPVLLHFGNCLFYMELTRSSHWVAG